MAKIRIIAGIYRHRRMEVADGPGLRPTADRVRETLFNWLQFELAGKKVLDAFAGTGALGLEALSRGAATVLFVDSHGPSLRAIEAVCRQWAVVGAQFRCGDALQLNTGEKFDLIFLDPPFQTELLPAAIDKFTDQLAESGLLYIESPEEITHLPRLTPYKASRAGQVYFSLWRKNNKSAEG